MEKEHSDKISGNDDNTLDTMIEFAMLYDFYGALLKDKNNEIFEDYMFNDMSLSEIAGERGMTRQGVRDIVVRSREKLVSFEQKLGLVERFNTVKKQINFIIEKTDEIEGIISENDGISSVSSKVMNEYFDMLKQMAGTILEDM